MDNLTQHQKARIYCVKHGHAPYVWKFWGYVHCGRCGEQIGDQLASCFDTREIAVIGCEERHTNKDDVCNKVIKSLSPMDRKIFNRLEKELDHDKAIKGIDFESG